MAPVRQLGPPPTVTSGGSAPERCSARDPICSADGDSAAFTNDGRWRGRCRAPDRSRVLAATAEEITATAGALAGARLNPGTGRCSSESVA